MSEITIIRDRRKSKRSSAGRRASDSLSGHIPGVVNLERWQIVDRALQDIDWRGGRILPETWALMDDRLKSMFEEKLRPAEEACHSK